MNPRPEKNILQNAVSDSRNPLFGRQKGLYRKVLLHRGPQAGKTGSIKPLFQRGTFGPGALIIRIVQIIPKGVDPAVHRHRQGQKTPVVEGHQQLIFGRNRVLSSVKPEVHAIRNGQMQVILQQHLDKRTAPHRPDDLPPRQQFRIFERISRIPCELMRMGGIEYIGDDTPRQRLANLPRNSLRFRNFDHRSNGN